MDIPSLLSITPFYTAVLGLLFVVFTLRAALYRVNEKISIGTGGDREMERRARSQANFIETVPMALFLLITMEILGASALWLHSLCSILVIARISHYIGLSKLGPFLFRPVGMIATLLTILVSSVWILVHAF